jgi:small-conductance mechanosensitive channel
MNPLEWAQYEVLGNSLLIWALGAAVFFIVWTALVLARRLLCNRLHKLADGRKLVALDIADQVFYATKQWFLFLIAAFIGSRFWALPATVDTVLVKGAIIVFVLQAGMWIINASLTVIEAKREEELKENRAAVAAMDVLSFVARVVIWSIVVLLILDNLGINITALVAGLGVGGIAVALAAQNILGDLFASLSIVLDKPFVVGDFLIIGEHLGSVEKVGIKTTRLRSLSGEQLVFSNNDLLGSRIRNYGRMFERRVVFSLGVTYQTSADQLKRIPSIIREAVEAQEEVRFDRAHFQKYGDFALVFEVVYYVLSPEYNKYMDIQQAINLQIFEQFEREGIEFAYPTQTLYLNRSDSTPDTARS